MANAAGNTLLAEKMGNPFRPWKKPKDISNYRIFIRFEDEDGKDVCGDLSCGTTKEGRRTKSRFTACMYREDEDGHLSGIPYDCRKSLNYDGTFFLPYTEEGILSYVNERSAKRYDRIKWVKSFSFANKPGDAFSPEEKVRSWADMNRLDFSDGEEGPVVNLYLGDYRYYDTAVKMCSGKGGPYEKVTLFLEEVNG